MSLSSIPDPDPEPTAARALRETRGWLEHAVVGLGLCPFAKAPWRKGQVRMVACQSDDPRVLLEMLEAEIRLLAAADPAQVETTLLVHPKALLDFDDFIDFLGAAEDLLADLGQEGVLQLASFHPDYRFEGVDADDPGNATNRSPHPTLHLLREASIDAADRAFPDASVIVDANIATLEALGPDGWQALRARWCEAAPEG